MPRLRNKSVVSDGSLWISLNAAAVSLAVLLVLGLLLLVASKGLAHFWPKALIEFEYSESDGSPALIIGQAVRSEPVPPSVTNTAAGMAEEEQRLLVKIANRDLGGDDFRWLLEGGVNSRATPQELVVLERQQWGQFYGRFVSFERAAQSLDGEIGWAEFLRSLRENRRLQDEIRDLENTVVGRVNYRLEKNRLAQRRLGLDGVENPEQRAVLEWEREGLDAEYRELEAALTDLHGQARRDTVTFATADGRQVTMELADIVDAWKPNAMSRLQQVGHFFAKLFYFLSAEPREANTEGGIFPAIFGTVLMVLLMTVVVAPFGVVAAVYLSEYAQQNFFTRVIRVTISNLAGVPSIVYGVFGLGIFVYTIGGGIDRLFYEPALPAPTFGTGGLLWASLTLALLTLPVVIVSTEEGLSRIPRNIREGSLALGATRWEMLRGTVLPMASPGIITGLILAVARAAGEVAPLMLVGVVKLAPSLPVDGNFPFFHLERKFMHLGFHIYDVGLQSPNVEATKPVVFATAFFLILVVLALNLVALNVRSSLDRQNKGLGS
jgi:phosphate transport system permease protein